MFVLQTPCKPHHPPHQKPVTSFWSPTLLCLSRQVCPPTWRRAGAGGGWSAAGGGPVRGLLVRGLQHANWRPWNLPSLLRHRGDQGPRELQRYRRCCRCRRTDRECVSKDPTNAFFGPTGNTDCAQDDSKANLMSEYYYCILFCFFYLYFLVSNFVNVWWFLNSTGEGVRVCVSIFSTPILILKLIDNSLIRITSHRN